MHVRDAMLPNPLMVRRDTCLLEFCSMILDCNQTTAVVVDDDQTLLGIASVHDVFGKIVPHYVGMDDKLANVIHAGYFAEKFEQFKELTIDEIMVSDVDSLSPDDSVIKAVSVLWGAKHKSMPVVEDGKFVGTITRRSVLRHVTDPGA